MLCSQKCPCRTIVENSVFVSISYKKQKTGGKNKRSNVGECKMEKYFAHRKQFTKKVCVFFVLAKEPVKLVESGSTRLSKLVTLLTAVQCTICTHNVCTNVFRVIEAQGFLCRTDRPGVNTENLHLNRNKIQSQDVYFECKRNRLKAKPGFT